MSSRRQLGLVMIVRDEAAILERCLTRVRELDLVDHWTICDTGSTDDTPALATELMRGIPGRLYRHQWRGFAWNRTLALRRARGSADWLLVIDADHLVTADERARELLAVDPLPVDAWNVLIHDHGLDYRLPLLVRGTAELRYVGATHECLDTVNTAHALGLELDHVGDGSARAGKLERDLLLLKPGLERRDPRATFYMAQTLRDLGSDRAAAVLYDRRSTLNGWEEERWYATYQAARLRRDVEELLEVWRARPWRHEPLTAAAAIVACDLRAAGDSLFLEPVPTTV